MMLSWKISVGFKGYLYHLVTSVMNLLPSQTQIFCASNVDIQLECEKRKDVAAEEVLYEPEDALHEAR